MNRNIEHYFYHKANFLDEKFCKNSINVLKEDVWEKHNWSTSAGLITQPSGNNEPEIINMHHITSEDTEEINKFIVEKLRSTLLHYVESFKFDWFGGWEGYSAMKFIRYSPGQTMTNHCDHIHSIFDGERRGVPILSVIGLLNDDYEGGELIMFEDKKIDTKKGDLLIFPSNFLYPHKVVPVTKGVRYSYTSWVW